jgi:hypothetical protein
MIQSWLLSFGYTIYYITIWTLNGEDRRLVDLVQVLLDPRKSQATDLSVWFGVVKGRDMSDLLAQRETYNKKKKEKNIQMAPRSSLIRFAFICIVLAVMVMTAESHNGTHHHGPAMAPMPPMAKAPSPSAATFSAYPQLIATALVAAMSFVF